LKIKGQYQVKSETRFGIRRNVSVNTDNSDLESIRDSLKIQPKRVSRM